MANDIGAFFNADQDKAEAAKNIAGHLTRFWDPRMRREIVAHYREGGVGTRTEADESPHAHLMHRGEVVIDQDASEDRDPDI
jgi:formate dehydrogenase subunit delta